MPTTKVSSKQQLTVTDNVSFGGLYRITNLVDPSAAQDAATKAYVDANSTGLTIKQPARVATNGSETYTISAGAVTEITGLIIDGVTLTTNDRILIKNSPSSSGAGAGLNTANTNFAPNGIYVVTGTAGSNLQVSRSTDADISAEVVAGMFIFVTEGNNGADNGYVLITNNPITLNTTTLEFAQFSGAGQIVAGAGLTKTGNTLNVGAGTGITVNADDIQISATYIGQSSITTLGTISTGTWSATTIAVDRGGTGRTSATAYMPLVGGTTTTGAHQSVSTGTTSGQALLYQGASAVPAFGALNLAGGANIITGSLPAANGGTGLSSYTIGDIIYASAATTLTTLAGVATGNALISGGVGAAPSWGKIGLTTHVSGTLGIGNGGTGLTTAPPNGNLLIGNGTNYTQAALTAGTGIAITNGAGSITIAVTGVLTSSSYVTREIPSGTINGTNPTFILANTPIAGTEIIFVNGILQNVGAGNDYTISTTTITFLTGSIPQSGDVILVSYLK